MSTDTLPSADHENDLICGNVKEVKNANQRSDAMYFLPLDEIVVREGYNVRVETDKYEEHLSAITDSMVSDGFHVDSPLSVYVAKIDGVNKPVLVRGHTRLKAAYRAILQGAKIDKVPVVFKPKTTSPTDLDLDLIKSNNGRNLTPYENAVVVKRVMNQGMDVPEIAKAAGFSVPYVQTLVTLASAPPKLAKLVAFDQVSVALAVDLIRKHGPVAAQRLGLEALERSKQAGHKQATVRNLPGAGFKRAIKKAAPQLFNITEAIIADPAYGSLADETRAKIDALLEEIKASQTVTDPASENPNALEGPGGV